MIRKNEHTNPKKERTGDRGQPTLEHQVYYRIDQRTTLRQRDPARWPRAREANTDLITVNAYNPTSAQGYPDRSRWPTSPKRDPGPQGPRLLLDEGPAGGGQVTGGWDPAQGSQASLTGRWRGR